MNLVTIDFETYWNSKDYTLSKMGPIEYIRDPRFHVQLCGVRINREPVVVYASDMNPIHTILYKLVEDPNNIILAHNGNGFDFLVLSEHYDLRPVWMLDTITMMRWTGLSRIGSESHKKLTATLQHGAKIDGTSISDGKHWPRDFSPAQQVAFKNYCGDDVVQCSENAYSIFEYCTPDFLLFTTIIARMATEPCLWLDQGLLEVYIQQLDAQTDKARQEISHMFGFNTQDEFLSNIRSPTKFPAMLRALGVEPPVKFSAAKTATAKAKLEAELRDLYNRPSARWTERTNELTNILNDPDSYAVYTPALSKTDLEFTDLVNHPDPNVALLVETRLANNSSIKRSRAEKFLTLARHNRPLPVMLNALKAHTSRLTAGNSEGSSDGTNLQNLNKRGTTDLTLRKAIKAPAKCKIIAVDSSQIEARMLAYMAQQLDLLYAFRNNEDPYSQNAEKVFQIEWQIIRDLAKQGDKKHKMYRNVGKTSVLSAGYQVGWKKYSDTLLRSGIRLHADLDQHHEMAKHAWNIYRMSNPNIVAFWAKCMEVVRCMEQGGSGSFGGPDDNLFQYGMYPIVGRGDLVVPSIIMPSGYIMRYPNLRVQEGDRGKPEYYYDRARGSRMVPCKIYGGSLCENLCQGISFQLLMWQACRMTEHHVPLKCNVHDAWIAVALETASEATYKMMMYWMSQVPTWLPGFPVACEGAIGDDYTIA